MVENMKQARAKPRRKLAVKKETVKDLTVKEARKVKGKGYYCIGIAIQSSGPTDRRS